MHNRKNGKRMVMINRELTNREKEIFLMIKQTTFWDIVEIVRKEIDNSRYSARRELKLLKNNENNENNIENDVNN